MYIEYLFIKNDKYSISSCELADVIPISIRDLFIRLTVKHLVAVAALTYLLYHSILSKKSLLEWTRNIFVLLITLSSFVCTRIVWLFFLGLHNGIHVQCLYITILYYNREQAQVLYLLQYTKDYLTVIDTETEFNLFLSLPLDRLYKDFSSVRENQVWERWENLLAHACALWCALWSMRYDPLKKHLTNIDVTQAVYVVQKIQKQF